MKIRKILFIFYHALILAMPSYLQASVLDFFDEMLKTYPEWVLPEFQYNPAAHGLFSQFKSFYYPKTLLSHDDCLLAVENAINSLVGSTNSSNCHDNLTRIAQNKEGYIQKISLQPGTRMIIFGDWHGGFHTVARTFCELIDTGICDKNLNIIQDNVLFMFLGDLVDYGRYSLETLITILDFKTKNPTKVFVCRGNHETIGMNTSDHGGLTKEIKSKFTRQEATCLLGSIYDFYEYLPYAIFAQIEGHNEAGFIQCCHGGLDTNAEIFINTLVHDSSLSIVSLHRKHNSPISNFMWADFHGDNIINKANTRGLGVKHYSIQEASDIMAFHNIRYVLRGHSDYFGFFKILMHGIASPFSPFPPLWHTINNPVIDSLKPIFVNPYYLAHYGFELSETEDGGVAPIFTFSGASAARNNHDEGYAILTVSTSWEESNLKIKTFTTQLMDARYALYQIPEPSLFTIDTNYQFEVLKKLLPVAMQNIQHTEALICAFKGINLLPHFTFIDLNGNVETFPVKTLAEDGNVHNFTFNPSCLPTTSLANSYFDTILHRHGAWPQEGPGISQAFMNRHNE